MSVDVRKYLESLAQTAGLDEASKTTLLKAVENDKFATELSRSIERQEDYSRNMDALKKDREALETDKTSWRDWYAKATAREAEINTELETLRKAAGSGGGNGGAGGAGGGGAGGSGGGTGGGMTRKELEDLLASERSRLIAVTKDMGVIAARHAVEFPKVAFDVNAIEKIALEKGLTVVKAYEEYVRPQVTEREKADVEARIAAARAEGVKEGMSKHGIPDDAATSRGHHVLFDRPKAADAVPTGRAKVESFAEAWNSAAAANAPKT